MITSKDKHKQIALEEKLQLEHRMSSRNDFKGKAKMHIRMWTNGCESIKVRTALNLFNKYSSKSELPC